MKINRLLLIAILPYILSCTNVKMPESIALAESSLRSAPDSALNILRGCDDVRNGNRYQRATWCLLNVWAGYNAYSSDLSLGQLDTACSYFFSKGTHLRKAQAHYLRGAVRQELKDGSEPEWVDDFLRGCREADKCADPYITTLVYNRYGIEMNNRRWYDEAIPALEKSVEAAAKAKMYGFQVTALINLSHSHLFIGDRNKDWSKATEYAMQACKVAEENSSRDSRARALMALSACYNRSGDFERALESSVEAVRIQEALVSEGARKERVRYNTLADAYRKVGNADSALFYARKSYDAPDIVSKLTSKQITYIIYRDLLHDNDSTVKYMSEYQELRNRQLESQKSGAVVENTVRFEKERSMSRSSRLAAVIGISVLVCVLLVLIMRRYRLIAERRQAQLQDAARELGRKEAELSARSEEKLKAERKAEKVSTELLDRDPLVASLRKAPRYLSDSEWSRLENLVDKVFDGYCSSLASAGLTSGNIRVACLMRLGFSTSDSALMLGISPASVTKAKQRLKSKLS
ncbi:MAG: transcriptional regulator [Candidatus Cryptobacteroides sp.]